jgi:hypothetical protein
MRRKILLAQVTSIDRDTGTVFFDDGTSIDHEGFMGAFIGFWKGRIAGETLDPSSIEHFMRRTSAKNLSLLMKGKKMEGYMEGRQGKMLTPGMKIAIGTIVTIIFVGLIVFVVMRNQGMIPGM